MAKFKQKMGICSYCGNHAVVTEDHVIPRSLFAGPMPSHPRPPKVLACPDCNNVMKSSDDTLLRDLLAADIVSQSHPDAQTNFANVRKAARANKSEFARYVSGSNRLISMFSKGGIFLGSAYEIKLPSGRVVQVLSNITRGLYAF